MKKIILIAFSLILCCSSLFSCNSGDTPPIDEAEESKTADTTSEESENDTITVGKKGKGSSFQIVYGEDDVEASKSAIYLANAFNNRMKILTKCIGDADADKEKDTEILIGAMSRPEYTELKNTLDEDEYAIKAVCDGEKTKIVIAYKGDYALMCAVNRFVNEYVGTDEKGIFLPADLDIKGNASDMDAIIVSKLPKLRDPFILVEDGTYYAYGTGWVCYKNTSGDLRGDWEYLGVVAEKPAESDGNYWAPEVHKYNGAYYMFTTYYSTVTQHRGCTVLKSDNPEGPFVEISNGHVTPSSWDAIDGTLYVDDDGQPWMIFVHEWTSTNDGIGRMDAAKMSDDLTHFISEPIELFRADSPVWSKAQVTDGCFLYRCEDGQLLMLWSNNDSAGYCIGVARSESGKVDGKWEQDKEQLYSKNMPGAEYDGGHGMIFYDTDGQMYLSMHSPNSAVGDRVETPVFIPVREQNGSIVWDLYGE